MINPTSHGRSSLQTVTLSPEAIPQPLKTLDRWVLWRWELRKGKWTKPPKQADDKFASTNDPRTWCSYEEAIQAYVEKEFDGLGIVLPEGIVGVDLDDCVIGSELTESAKMLLAMLPGTYAEISPSGTGVKLLCTGQLDKKLSKVCHPKGIELYDGGDTNRYFTLTGNVIDDRRIILAGRDGLYAIQSMISEPMRDVQIENDAERKEKAIEFLKHIKSERADNYDEWLKVGMSLSWADKSDEMLERWIDWSSSSAKFDRDVCISKWESFKREEGRLLTVGHLERVAKADGYAPRGWLPKDVCDLREGNEPDRGEELIEGLLRDGEVCFVVSSAKAGKSWLAGQLIYSFVAGNPFLGMGVKKGRVVLIDNELKAREIDYRLSKIAIAMGHKQRPGEVTVFNRRGLSSDVREMIPQLLKLDLSGYVAIVIDCLYKSLPTGTDENKAESMGLVMNELQRLAEETGLAVIIVHHTPKGDTSDRSLIDLGAGSGAIGRSLDSLIGIRDHLTEGLAVAEFKQRTNSPIDQKSIRFDFPLWKLEDAPAIKLTKDLKAQRRQNQKDSDRKAEILGLLQDGELCQTELVSSLSFVRTAGAVLGRLRDMLEEEGEIVLRRDGKKVIWSLS